MKRVLVLGNLTLLKIPFAIFGRLLFGEIYYCTISRGLFNLLHKKGVYQLLSEMKIAWVKTRYSEFSEYRYGVKISTEWAKKKVEEIVSVGGDRDLLMALGYSNELKKQINTLWQKTLYYLISEDGEKIAAVRHIKGHNENCYVFSLTLGVSEVSRWSQLNKIVVWVVFICSEVISLFSYVTKKMIEGARVFSSVSADQDRKIYSGLSDVGDLAQYRVAFFPHHGMYYGDIFKKDHYYSKPGRDGKGFLQSEILHVGLENDAVELSERTRRYYVENKIKYINIFSIIPSYKDMFWVCVRTIFLSGRMRWFATFLSSPYVFKSVLLLSIKVMRYRILKERVPNLSVGLVGYDWLFPPELSFALSASGVVMCANQERVIQAFYPDTYMIYDQYYVCSDYFFGIYRNSSIKSYIATGLVRVDILKNINKLDCNNMLPDGVESQPIIAIYDYHVSNELYDELLRPVGKVEQLINFYESLIFCARKFRGYNFVIRSKLAGQFDAQSLRGVKLRIDSEPNIFVYESREEMGSYYLASSAILTVACHTSIADEIMAVGGRVIFYEMSDYLGIHFNYEGLVPIVRNKCGLYDEIIKQIDCPAGSAYRRGKLIKMLGGDTSSSSRELISRQLGDLQVGCF